MCPQTHTMTIYTEAKNRRWPPTGFQIWFPGECDTQFQTPQETDSKAIWEPSSDLSWLRCIYGHGVCLHSLQWGWCRVAFTGVDAFRGARASSSVSSVYISSALLTRRDFRHTT